DLDQLLRMGNPKIAEQQGVDECEDRGRRADAQRERCDGGCREQRGASHQWEGEGEVAPERVERCPGPLLADLNCESRRPTQLEQRLPSGLRGVEPGPDLFVDREIED